MSRELQDQAGKADLGTRMVSRYEIRPTLFIFYVVFFLSSAYLLQDSSPPVDIFARISANQLVDLDHLTVQELTNAKFLHAQNNSAFKVGLFGNSRSVNVGAADIRLTDNDFFNFSVPGTSFRGTVALIEHLAEAGKLPPVIVISFDHTELQYYKNPDFPKMAHRYGQVLKDITRGILGADISSKQTCRMIWRHVNNEMIIFKNTFTFEHLWRRVLWCFGVDDLIQYTISRDDFFDRNGYLHDGSRVSSKKNNLLKIDVLEPAPSQIIRGYLEYDFDRLSKVARENGTRVIIYESMLEPASADYFLRHPSSHAARSREQLMAIGERLGLEIYPATAMQAEGGGFLGNWTDSNHPPAELLGFYLSRLIALKELQR